MDYETAKKYFYYKDGLLFWNSKIGNKNIHNIAGCNGPGGYKVVSLFKKAYKVHRIIFLLNHKYCPDIVDHIDRNKQNNNISNLRSATKSQNAMNSKARADGIAGFKNIRLRKGRTKNDYFEVTIRKDKKTFYIGVFSSLIDAKHAAIKAQKEFHGEFSPLLWRE